MRYRREREFWREKTEKEMSSRYAEKCGADRQKGGEEEQGGLCRPAEVRGIGKAES